MNGKKLDSLKKKTGAKKGKPSLKEKLETTKVGILEGNKKKV